MGFFSGLTANGLLGAVGRMGRAGGGPVAPAGPAYGSDGRDLLDRLRTAMDPERLAIAQALLAGDYKTVSRITEPLRRRRLAEREAAERNGESAKSFASQDKAALAGRGEPCEPLAPGGMPSRHGPDDGEIELAAYQVGAGAGMDPNGLRLRPTRPEPERGQVVGEAIDQEASLARNRQDRQPPAPRCVGNRYAEFFRQNSWPVAQIASRRGTDPTLLLGLAAHESGWGDSRMARTQNNPFGATPHGDASSGVSYPSIPHAWGVWDSEWGRRVDGIGSDALSFVHNLAQDNRSATQGVDRRGAYNPQTRKLDGDPDWKGSVLDTIDSVRRRYADWLASGC